MDKGGSYCVDYQIMIKNKLKIRTVKIVLLCGVHRTKVVNLNLFDS